MGLFDRTKDDGHAAVPEPTPPTPEDIAAALDHLDARLATPNLSSAVTYRVARITRRLRDTLPRMSTVGLTSADHYALIATATSYLPLTIGAYMRLPRDWADTRPVDAGRSSLLVLIDQLDLLAVTVDKIYDAVVARDAQALVIQGKFLAEKFAPGVPAPAPVPTIATPASTLDLG